MNVFKVAHRVNKRLNDGDKSKFSVTLIVVSEILYVAKPINYFGWITYGILKGKFDEKIISTTQDCNYLYNEIGHLEAFIEIQNASRIGFENSEKINKKIKKALIVGSLGLTIAIGGILSLIFKKEK